MQAFRRYRFHILFGLGITIIAAGLTLDIATLIDHHNKTVNVTSTMKAILLTNSWVNTYMAGCDNIRNITGSTNPCEGYWIDSWTVTPSPLPKDFPTFSEIEGTATKNAHQLAITGTLSVVCPTLTAFHMRSSYCRS